MDESLSLPGQSRLGLSLQIGANGLLYCVIDASRNKYLALYHRPFGITTHASKIPVLLNELYYTHSFLKNTSFVTVNVAVVNDCATLIPASLFDEKNAADYLRFNRTVNEEDSVLFDRIGIPDIVNVFSVPAAVVRTVKELFPLAVVRHYASPLIEGLLLQHKNEQKKKMFVNTGETRFEIIVTEGRKLFFYNSFAYEAPEDFLYFVIAVMEELELNPEMQEVILLGHVDKYAPLYELLLRYVRNVCFGPRNDAFEYSYALDVLPPHAFYDLFSQNLCA